MDQSSSPIHTGGGEGRINDHLSISSLSNLSYIQLLLPPPLLLHFKNSPFVSLQCCLPSRQPPLESLLLAIDSSSLRLLENHYSEASKVSRIVSSNEWWARLHYSWGKIIRQRNVDRPKESPWRSPRGGGREIGG